MGATKHPLPSKVASKNSGPVSSWTMMKIADGILLEVGGCGSLVLILKEPRGATRNTALLRFTCVPRMDAFFYHAENGTVFHQNWQGKRRRSQPGKQFHQQQRKPSTSNDVKHQFIRGAVEEKNNTVYVSRDSQHVGVLTKRLNVKAFERQTNALVGNDKCAEDWRLFLGFGVWDGNSEFLALGMSCK